MPFCPAEGKGRYSATAGKECRKDATLGLEDQIVDQRVLDRAVRRFRKAEIVLPAFAELAEPGRSRTGSGARWLACRRTRPHPLNLFRVHWHNGPDRTGQVPVPVYADLPGELTGVDARIVVAIGDLFPMIRAHKVLAAYGCLAPRVITGQFDPTRQPGDLAVHR